MHKQKLISFISSRGHHQEGEGGGGKKAHISGEPRAFLRGGGGGGLSKKILMAQCKEQVLYLGGFGFRKIT